MTSSWNRRQPNSKLPSKSDTAHSQYVQMLLEQDAMPSTHNVLASFFVWLLLAGFIVFPGTFTSIQKSMEHEPQSQWGGEATCKIAKRFKNLPLLVVATVVCAVSVAGIAGLAIRHANNYIWLCNKLFMPALANCLTGLMSTLVGVYTQQHGTWSITARVTATVEGAGLVVSGLLFVIFDACLLQRVKRRHGGHYNRWPHVRGSGQRRSGK